ncbi:hypothetical protein ACGGZK_02225 [Agromyces sp. MMS24-K17]|uniref:hypothetical protein n=1 Tax=Agromyces sp. MMS24-K17 TaxID=3372850 RepID=UPI003754C5FE
MVALAEFHYERDGATTIDAVTLFWWTRGRTRAGGSQSGREHSLLFGGTAHEQVHRLVAESGARASHISTLACIGLRWGELTALRVGSVDFTRKRIHVAENAVEVGGVIHFGTPKAYKNHTVPLPAFLQAHLREQIGVRPPDELLFPGPTGDYMRRMRTSTG